MFTSQAWKPAAPPMVREPVRETLAAPAMPYRVVGQMLQAGVIHVVLARGDSILAVREGDTLEGGYRVEAVHTDRVTLLYLPLNAVEDIPITASLMVERPAQRQPPIAAAAEQTARVRWEGPPQVSAGTTFDVALKVTSAEAVRAAPLQLTFDADVLEPVAVRAGGFFSEGLFSYRVNPAGSISIGASGKGQTASDAELVVVRFKPIRAPGTAELKVSALALQDPRGRTIAHERPATFRTEVVQ